MKNKLNILRFVPVWIILLCFSHPVSSVAPENAHLHLGSESESIQELSLIDTLIDQAYRQVEISPLKSIAFAKEALQLADSANVPDKAHRARMILGSSLLDIDRKDSAMMLLRQSYAGIEEFFDEKWYFFILNELGRAHSKYEQYDSALFFYEKLMHYAEENNNLEFKAKSYGNLAIVASARGQRNQAYEYYLLALKHFEEAGDLRNQATVHNNLGRINHQIGEYERSIPFFEEAIRINKKIDNQVALSMNYGNLGISLEKIDRNEEALEAYQASTEIAKTHNLIRGLARVLQSTSRLHLKLGDTASARQNLVESLQISEAYDIYYGIMINHLSLAELAYHQNDFVTAQKHLQPAEETALKYRFTGDLSHIYDLASKINQAQDRYKEALYYKEKFIAQRDSLDEIANKEFILDLQTRYESEKKALENKQLRLENVQKSRTIRMHLVTTLVVIIALIALSILSLIAVRSRKKLHIANKKLQQLNEKMQEQNQQLQSVNETKDKLLSIIGHDLRSPFNSMLGLLQMLITEQESFEPKEKKEILEALFKQTNDTYNTVENLLQWALSQRGLIKCTPEIHPLDRIIEEEMNFLQSRAKMKKISIINKLPENTQAYVDKALTSIIFRNLMVNAIKYSFENSRIEVSCTSGDNTVTVYIQDEGMGMSAEQVKNIEEGAEPITSRGTKNETGTGLGLSIVKDFIKLQNGRLTIESKQGKGSCFSVSFPRGEA